MLCLMEVWSWKMPLQKLESERGFGSDQTCSRQTDLFELLDKPVVRRQRYDLLVPCKQTLHRHQVRAIQTGANQSRAFLDPPGMDQVGPDAFAQPPNQERIGPEK